MKKLFLSTTFLIAGSLSILAQGLVVFDNYPTTFPDSATVDRLVYLDSIGGAKLPGDGTYSAGLFELRGADYTQLGDLCPFDDGNNLGIWTWDGADRTISKAQGTATTLQVRIFKGTAELAKSPDFAYTHISQSPAGAFDTSMVNFRAFAVPEPSTIALGVVGLGALLLFRRRK